MNSRNIFAAGAALLAATVAMAPGPAAAGNQSLVRAMAHCGTVDDSAKRLACYDALEPQVQAALTSPQAPAAAAPVAAATMPSTAPEQAGLGAAGASQFGVPAARQRQTTPQQFGQDDLPAASSKTASNTPQEVDSITASVTKFGFNALGKFVVHLSNGQVWAQIQGDTGVAHFRRNPGDNTVTISRGFIGSYNMTMNGSNQLYKVKRIK